MGVGLGLLFDRKGKGHLWKWTNLVLNTGFLAVWCQEVTLPFQICFLIFNLLFHVVYHTHLPMLVYTYLLPPLQ